MWSLQNKKKNAKIDATLYRWFHCWGRKIDVIDLMCFYVQGTTWCPSENIILIENCYSSKKVIENCSHRNTLATELDQVTCKRYIAQKCNVVQSKRRHKKNVGKKNKSSLFMSFKMKAILKKKNFVLYAGYSEHVLNGIGFLLEHLN